MNLRATVAILGLAGTGCVHQVQSTRVTTPPKPQTVWDRQINNARDAGDGDYQLRALRERVAAEPENIAIRVELANLYRQKGYPDIAVELCRLTAGRFPDSGEAQVALVRALHDLHRSVEAAAGLDQFLNSHPQTTPDY